MNYPRVVGNFYYTLASLGVLSLGWAVYAMITTDSLQADLSWILWLALGYFIHRRGRRARLLAIFIAAACSLLIPFAVLFGPGYVHFFGHVSSRGDTSYYIITALLLAVMGFPLILLSKRAKVQFDQKK